MGITKNLTSALLAGVALFAMAGAAAADTPSVSPGTADGDSGPTEAGTTFRTATAIQPGQRATARASAGDYLYWVFPADAQQRPTVRATVTLPEAARRHGVSTWQLDVYDGLRRRQACMYGRQTRAVAAADRSVELSCTLRPVRALAEPWSNDPLPGSYYLRLTVIDLPDQDLGLPIQAEVEATIKGLGGSHAVDGSLSTALVPGAAAQQTQDGQDGQRSAAVGEPEDGWSSGWWTDRWLWSAAGGVLGALAGIGGYCLTRGRGRPPRVPPGA